jgi:hypothetical protein
LQPALEEFNFLAPEEGYSQSDEIDMPRSLDRKWSGDAGRKYYLSLPGGKYARMEFAMIARGDHFCIVESFLNPSGSRNLEYDSTVQPKPAVFE